MDSTKKYVTQEQQILSICYGYGGLEKGVKSIIPIRTITYVEIEAFQIFNLVTAMEAGMVDQAPVWTDLKTFNPKPFHKKIHGIVGGYPCQGESVAGRRKLWNDPRFLWPYIEKYINTIRPIWCFFENVAGHLSGSMPYVLESLRSLGYSVEAGLFTASEIGAPQHRKRVFILAIEKNMGYSNFNGHGTGNNTFYETSTKIKKATQRSNRKRSGHVIRDTSQKMADTCSKRLQGMQQGWVSRQRKGISGSIAKFRKKRADKWPARPGEEQYDWEEPRAIEPGLGCTVDGYNFRTELLRQYGNGVVSQQAAYAFETLLNKHLKNKRNDI